MSLEQSLKEIKDYILSRYKDNLVGVLVLGSANTGHYLEGESDINTMILVKELMSLDPANEIEKLTANLKKYRFQSQYFHSLDSIKKYLQERKSFATYLVIIADDGSRILYSTPEFDKLKANLRENPFTKEDIIEHLKKKDDFEIDGYMKERSEKQFMKRNYRQTQNLLFHLRRKIQVMNYLNGGKLVFDLNECLSNLPLDCEDKVKIYELYDRYRKRETLSDKEVENYFDLAREFTKKISSS